jgi:type IX secretion system PorP/SprF family membrane protein
MIMKKYINKIILSGIVLLSIFATTYAQTVGSYSQYQLTPTLVNPANAGMNDEVRVVLHYRKQALSGDIGFSTAALSFLYPLSDKANAANNIYRGGFNITALQEQSGANGMLQTSEIIGGGVYNLDISGTNYVSLGLQGAYFHQKIDISRITTDNQYVDNTYDPAAPLGEIFDTKGKGTMQFNAGLTWVMTDEERSTLFWCGAALYNLSQSEMSLLSPAENTVISFSADAGVRLNKAGKLTVTPTARMIYSDKIDQLNIGTLLEYAVSSEPKSNSITLGTWYSLQRSIVLALIYSTSNYGIAIGYDQSINSEFEDEPVNNAVEAHLFWNIKRRQPIR